MYFEFSVGFALEVLIYIFLKIFYGPFVFYKFSNHLILILLNFRVYVISFDLLILSITLY